MHSPKFTSCPHQPIWGIRILVGFLFFVAAMMGALIGDGNRGNHDVADPWLALPIMAFALALTSTALGLRWRSRFTPYAVVAFGIAVWLMSIPIGYFVLS